MANISEMQGKSADLELEKRRITFIKMKTELTAARLKYFEQALGELHLQNDFGPCRIPYLLH